MFEWSSLRAEIRRWSAAGRKPRLWWRDDGAREATLQLHRLIGHAARADLPLCLAVNPQDVGPGLCAAAAFYPGVTVLQHGVSCAEGAGRPPECSPDEPPAQVAARLSGGWSALDGFGCRLPVYVPTRNVLTSNVEAALSLSGHRAASAWGELSRPGRVDTHVDVILWRRRPRFAGAGPVLGQLTGLLAARRRAGLWDEPIGLLTHHLFHDEQAWRFLERLLLFPPLRDDAAWPSAAAVFGIPQ